MTALTTSRLVQFLRDQKGAALPELAIIIPLFLFLFFVVIDFGLLGWHRVMTEKAVQRAIRIAVVRTPPEACVDSSGNQVPSYYARGSATPIPSFGTNCNSGSNICEAVETISCAGYDDSGNDDPTFTEIWGAVSGILPSTSEISDLTLTYTYEETLGFLGGPYTPVVSVELDVPYNFITNLGGLAVLAGAGSSDLGNSSQISFIQSASLPAEDLWSGGN